MTRKLYATAGWRVDTEILDLVDRYATSHHISKNAAAMELIRRGYGAAEREGSKMFEIHWEREQNPQWDSTGTVAESWYAQVGRYELRIDRFRDTEGGGYAYTVSADGSPLHNAENEAADSFEGAEEAILGILAAKA